MATPLLAVSTEEHCFDVQFHPSEPILVTSTINGSVTLHRYWEREIEKAAKVDEGLDSDYEVERDLDERPSLVAQATDEEGTAGEAADGAEIAGRTQDFRDDGAYTAECANVIRCHEESCRTVRFLPSGKGKKSRATRLVTASADSTAAVWDVAASKQLSSHPLKSGGNSVLPIDSYCFAVGDDEGGVYIFDVRQGSVHPVRKYEENEDFITDMVMGSDDNSLCVTSGDGTLAVYDVRKKPRLIAMSDFQEDEFMSLTLMREGTKVVCGSQNGVLCIFTWGDFGDQKDRIPGHPMSVDALAKLREDVLLTGASDGKVRIVTTYHPLYGNRIIGEVAQHGAWPIERLSLSPDGQFFATASHSQPAVKLWRVEDAVRLLEEFDPVENFPVKSGPQSLDPLSDASSEPPAKRAKKGKRAAKKRPKSMATTQQLFFSKMS